MTQHKNLLYHRNENHTSKKWFIPNSNLMDHWVFVGVTNRNIGDGYLWEQKWFKSSCITEKPNPTGMPTDESWNPGALCTTCTQLDSLEISSLEFSWSESLPARRETTGDYCCSPRHTVFSLLLSLLGLPILCWGDIWILRKFLNTSKKLAEARQCVADVDSLHGALKRAIRENVKIKCKVQ